METNDVKGLQDNKFFFPEILEEEQNLPSTIIIKDFNSNFVRLDLRLINTFGDIRKFCLSIPSLSYITNYDLILEKTNAVCDDSDPIANYQLNDFDIIKMVPCLYTKSSLKKHVEVMKYIMYENPPFINKFTEKSQVIYKDIDNLVTNAKGDHDKTRQFVKDYVEEVHGKRSNKVNQEKDKGDKNSNDPKESEDNSNEKKEEEVETKEKTEKTEKYELNTDSNTSPKNNANNIISTNNTNTKSTNNTTSTNNTNTKDSNKYKDATTEKTEADILAEDEKFKKEFKEKIEEGLKNLKEIKEKVLDIDFKRFSLSNLQKSNLFEDQAKPKRFKCINSIYYSAFNQDIEKLSSECGYLYFLEVNTLENVEVNITASVKGFYVNATTPKIFNPTPVHPLSHSYTLVGLLSQVSTQFKENFIKLMTQVLTVDPIFFIPTPNNRIGWLKPQEDEYYYNYIHRFGENLIDIHEGKKPTREWNEELQSVFDLKIPNNIESLQKEKLLYSLYNNFKESSIEGAKLIVEKQLQPVSFFDTPNKGLYIYNNIFLTILEDSYLNFKTFNNANVTQTFLGASLDIKHLNFINKSMQDYNFYKFYFSLTCNIHYRGQRIQAQIIIPGIIFNSESMIEYGQIEEGNIKYSEEFYNEIKKFNQKLGIDENMVLDKEGKAYLFSGHPEIKGVRGIDKRKYLFDLIHILPRDGNYSGNDNLGCILRPELLNNYKYKTAEEILQQKYSKDLEIFNKELEELNKNYGKVKNYKKSLEELLIKRKGLYDQMKTESNDIIKFNTCLFTNVKFADSQKQKLEDDEKRLNELAQFVKEDMINEYLKKFLILKEDLPCDSKTLAESIHRYGINCRYYGEIIRRIEKNPKNEKNNSWLKTLVTRDIFVRSTKHIFDNLVKNIPPHLTTYFISYFLNIFLCSPQIIKMLENHEVQYKNGEMKLVHYSQVQNKEKEEETADKETKNKNSEKHKKKKEKKKLKKDKEYEFKSFFMESMSNTKLNLMVEFEQLNEFFIKPSDFWSQVSEVAINKYGYEIPNKTNFDYIDPMFNKFGMLRDLCLKVGLQVEDKDYEFFLEPSFFKNEFKYEHLTFQPKNIITMYPVMKDIELPSEITKIVLEQAETFYNTGNLMHAMEKFNQTALIHDEIHGSVNNITAHAYRRMGQICFLTGDIMNAILNCQKSIALYEKNLNFDISTVSQAYSELAQYYHVEQQDYFAVRAYYKSLEILYFTVPKNHPELALRLYTLAFFYNDLEIFDLSRDMLETSDKISLMFYDEFDPNMAKTYLYLSTLYHRTKNITKCIYYYEKYNKILKLMKENEKIINESEKVLEGLKIAHDEYKKKQNAFKNYDSKRLYDEICLKHISKLLTHEDKINFIANNMSQFKEKEFQTTIKEKEKEK